MTRRASPFIVFWAAAAWVAAAAANVAPLLAAVPVLAGAGMMVLVDRRGRASTATLGVRSRMSDAEKHLARCRRRGDEALVFAVRMPADDRALVATLADAVRVTDGVGVTTHGRDRVVHGVIDDAGEESAGAIARRLHVLGLAPHGSLGWARFPADGVTLGALIEVALAASREDTERRLPRLSEAHGLAQADGRGERIVYETEST
jgi:hypothetical protein